MAAVETLPELVEYQEIPSIELEHEMGISKEDGTLEAAEEIIDPLVPSLGEGEPPITIFMATISTPEETSGVHRSSRARS